MTMKAAVEKNTFFFVSFKTDKDFREKNRTLIQTVEMLRSRPDKVPNGLKLFMSVRHLSVGTPLKSQNLIYITRYSYLLHRLPR